jgi:CheY-like chemotaxis protein
MDRKNHGGTVHRVQLIHWNAAEAQERAERIRAAGYKVTHELPPGNELLRRLKADPPIAVVIDLTRLPSHGRDIGLALRHSKATRHVPLIFVDGDPEKVDRVKKLLPDAVYTSWSHIRDALEQAIAHPPADPRVPQSMLEGYSDTPLPQKLGIKKNSVVGLIDAPQGFGETLGDLPDGVQLRQQARGRCDLIIWFTRSRDNLESRIDRMTARSDYASLWIAWPKKSSGGTTDLTQKVVRQVGLAAGLVDFKICAIDDTWSGLRFARRKTV